MIHKVNHIVGNIRNDGGNGNGANDQGQDQDSAIVKDVVNTLSSFDNAQNERITIPHCTFTTYLIQSQNCLGRNFWYNC